MRIFVDMDGTLAQWNNVEFEQLFEQGYYRNLKPNQALVADVNKLIKKGEDVYILSAYLTDSEYAKAEKEEWVRQYLPELKDENKIFVPYGTNKAEYLKEHYSPIKADDYLIDDYTQNLLEWKEYGGTGVKYLNGINHTRGTWQGLRLNSYEIKTFGYSDKIKYSLELALDLPYLIENEKSFLSSNVHKTKYPLDELYFKLRYPCLSECADFDKIVNVLSPDLLTDMEYSIFLWNYTDTCAVAKETNKIYFKGDFENQDRFNEWCISWYEGGIDTTQLVQEYADDVGLTKYYLQEGDMASAYNVYTSIYDRYAIDEANDTPDTMEAKSKALQDELRAFSDEEIYTLTDYGKRLSEQATGRVIDNTDEIEME